MKPYYEDPNITLYNADVLAALKGLPNESVHCAITSPPYWGLRDYKTDGQIGLEQTPEQYVAKMVEVFHEVKRVLRKDGTCWLNMGDSYNGLKVGNTNEKWASVNTDSFTKLPAPGLKPKDLVGIPWRVAFALQADGWYLRSDIIWAKPNPMPESVTDRPTKSHEYLFLLAKSERYYYDAEAIKEPQSPNTHDKGSNSHQKLEVYGKGVRANDSFTNSIPETFIGGRNKRSVWTIATEAYPESHFATFPEKLVEPCILAGTSERGVCSKCGAPWERMVEHKPMGIDRSSRTHELGRTRTSGTMTEPATSTTLGWRPTCDCDAPITQAAVLEPFAGSGTTLAVAKRLNRKSIGIELSAEYCKLAQKRIGAVTMPMPL